MVEERTSRDLFEARKAARLEKADPYTWAWVGEQVVAGAVAWVGGRIMDAIFGSDEDGEARLIDAMERGFAGLKRFVALELRSALQEQEIAQLKALARAAHRNLRQYMATPEASKPAFRYLVRDVNLSTSNTLSLCENHGADAIPVYAQAFTTRLVALYELYDLKRYNESMPLGTLSDDEYLRWLDELQLVSDEIGSAYTYMAKRLNQMERNALGNVGFWEPPHCHRYWDEDMWVWTCRSTWHASPDTGAPDRFLSEYGNDPEGPRNRLQQSIVRDRAARLSELHDLERNLLLPMRDIMRGWQTLGDKMAGWDFG